MAVTGTELISITPVWKNPNKFYWQSKVQSTGDATGGNVTHYHLFSDINLFGGHWLFDLRHVSIVISDTAVSYWYQVSILSYQQARGTAYLAWHRGGKLAAPVSETIIGDGEAALLPPYWVRYKPNYPMGYNPQLVVAMTPNTDTKTYNSYVGGYIYNEALEGSIGSI